MAKMTKAQARKRLQEARTKISAVYMGWATGNFDLTKPEAKQLFEATMYLDRIRKKLK